MAHGRARLDRAGHGVALGLDRDYFHYLPTWCGWVPIRPGLGREWYKSRVVGVEREEDDSCCCVEDVDVDVDNGGCYCG